MSRTERDPKARRRACAKRRARLAAAAVRILRRVPEAFGRATQAAVDSYRADRDAGRTTPERW
jgi:hypothetical protein